MPMYHQLGQVPSKRHVVFRRPDGALYAEELIGNKGFEGPSSLLYHVHQPTHVKIGAARARSELGGRSRPASSGTAISGRTSSRPAAASPLDRVPLLFNTDVAMLVRAARSRGRLLLPQRAGRRDRVRQRRRRRAADAARRHPVRAGRLPRHPARHHAPLHVHGHARALPRDREPRVRAHAEAVSQRARPADGDEPVLGARHPAARRSCRRTTRAASTSWS